MVNGEKTELNTRFVTFLDRQELSQVGTLYCLKIGAAICYRPDSI